jgi:hypothetical protein
MMDSSDEEFNDTDPRRLFHIDQSEFDLAGFDLNLSDEEYVQLFIDHVVDIFNKERGRDETKKANLGDIKATQIDTSVILQ